MVLTAVGWPAATVLVNTNLWHKKAGPLYYHIKQVCRSGREKNAGRQVEVRIKTPQPPWMSAT